MTLKEKAFDIVTMDRREAKGPWVRLNAEGLCRVLCWPTPTRWHNMQFADGEIRKILGEKIW